MLLSEKNSQRVSENKKGRSASILRQGDTKNIIRARITVQNSTQNVNFARKFRSHYVFGVVSAHEFKQKDREFVIRDPFFIRKMDPSASKKRKRALGPIFQWKNGTKID